MTTFETLTALAENMWWSWNPDALALYRSLNPDEFCLSGNNPKAALASARQEVLASEHFASQVADVYTRFKEYLETTGSLHSAPRTAYFCMEYGLHESLRMYSGGLGILAGDHLKAASDAGVPMTAVGILHRHGYFRQSFDEDLNQQVSHTMLDPGMQPLSRVLDDSGALLRVTVHFGQEPVYLQAWRLPVGRVTLYLLDPDIPENPDEIRKLCHRLYQGDKRDRLRQEIILGIGGIRLLRALGMEFDVFHMNEGHSAFLSLELTREAGENIDLGRIREKCIFTSHTPVRAGHDRFTPELFEAELGEFISTLPLTLDETLALGRVHPDDKEELFTMTVLGLKLSRAANAVSRLNAEVTRAQWQELYPTLQKSNIPIGHVTNGVHLATWANPKAWPFLDKQLPGWNCTGSSRTSSSRTGSSLRSDSFAAVTDLSSSDLWNYRCMLRADLIDFVQERSRTQSFQQKVDLDPHALTIGFARRFATYKRAPLFFKDPERAAAILGNPDRPVQIVYAGKAHPADQPGQAFIREILEFSRHESFCGRVVFLEDYNMEIGRKLISGCDVWLNNPRKPKEACGTSGQKITIHGGLNLSILDGWWAEGYDGQNGWAIDSETNPATDHATGQAIDQNSHTEAQTDILDATAIYELLENNVTPLFYSRDHEGIPVEWVDKIRHAIFSLAYPFSAERMMQEYVERFYENEIADSGQRIANRG